MRYTPFAGELSDLVQGKSVLVATICFKGESDRAELIRFIRIFEGFLRANLNLRANRSSQSFKPSIEIKGKAHTTFNLLKTIDEMIDIDIKFVLPGLYASEIIREYTRVSLQLHKDHGVTESFHDMRKQFQLDATPALLH